MSNISKAKHTFDQRFYRFDQDIELVDYISTQISKKALSSTGKLFSGNLLKYENLSSLSKNKSEKQLSSNRKSLITHLKKTLFSSYIKDCYEEVTEYLKTILKNASASKKRTIGTERIIGKQSKITLSGKEIIDATDIKELIDSLINKLFQEIEKEKSTLSLIKEICSKLDLEIDNSIMNKSVSYLNIRHYLVHSDGKLPLTFIEELKKNNITVSFDRYNFIKLNYELIKEFKLSVSILIETIDLLLIENHILDNKFIHLNKND